MPITTLSEKGQITLPASVRRKLGWTAGRHLQVDESNGEVVIRPIRTIDELSGIFHEAVRGRKPLSIEEETVGYERAVAEHVANE